MSPGTLNWRIHREPWEFQKAYGDDAIIEIVDGKHHLLGISVCEVIEDVGTRFVLAHVLECLRQGVFQPDANLLDAGEIAALAHAMNNDHARLARSAKKAKQARDGQ